MYLIVEELDLAYNMACKEDIQEVFNARMNLVGHREAGKTSLATRLMGQEFKEDVQSTEGVSMHLIKTTVDKNLMRGSVWNETTESTSDLLKLFAHAVLERAKQIPSKQLLGIKPTSPPKKLSLSNLSSNGKKSIEIKEEQGIQLQSINNESSMEHLPTMSYPMMTHETIRKGSKRKSRRNRKSNQKKSVAVEVQTATPAQIQPAETLVTNPRLTVSEETKPTILEQGNSMNQIETKVDTVKEDDSKKEMDIRNEILTHGQLLEEEQPTDDIPISIRLWDLGGQNEFITTHHLFLDAESTTVIVMDITKPLHQELEKNPKLGHPNTPAEVLHYWLNSLHVQSSGQNMNPSIALVLTHVDLISVAVCELFTESYINDILKTVDGKAYGYLLRRENIYIVNNKSADDGDFQKLRNQLIYHLAQQNTWGQKMPVSWLKLKADIIETSQTVRHLQLNQVTDLAKQYRMDAEDVESFLNIQNIQGDFIFKSFPDLRNTVITDPQWLVDRYSSLITHHTFLDERVLTKSTFQSLKHGYVTENGLHELWEKDQVDFLKNLMTKYNLIVPLDETGMTHLIPSMLPTRDVNIHNLSLFKDMHIVYSADQIPRVGETLLVGTFHKFLSECSKTQNWKLCAKDHLSYTDVSFEISCGVRLTLTLLKHDHLRCTIWFSTQALNVPKSKLISIIEDSRDKLSVNMSHLNIAGVNIFHTLCPHHEASDQYLCLVKRIETMDPRTNVLSSRYLRRMCTLHGKVLHTSIPSLFTLASGR